MPSRVWTKWTWFDSFDSVADPFICSMTRRRIASKFLRSSAASASRPLAASARLPVSVPPVLATGAAIVWNADLDTCGPTLLCDSSESPPDGPAPPIPSLCVSISVGAK